MGAARFEVSEQARPRAKDESGDGSKGDERLMLFLEAWNKARMTMMPASQFTMLQEIRRHLERFRIGIESLWNARMRQAIREFRFLSVALPEHRQSL
jgi:hypothetical protein